MSALPPARSRIPALPSRSNEPQRISGREAHVAAGRNEGVWVGFDSTNVEMAKVEPQYDLNGQKTGIGTITIQFLNGAQYEYADRPMSDWYDLIESSSKGRKTYYDVRGPGKSRPGMGLWKPCVQIRKPTRTSAQVAALASRRKPRSASDRRRTFTRGGRRNAFGAGGFAVG
jgi:hypothetical protein